MKAAKLTLTETASYAISPCRKLFLCVYLESDQDLLDVMAASALEVDVAVRIYSTDNYSNFETADWTAGKSMAVIR